MKKNQSNSIIAISLLILGVAYYCGVLFASRAILFKKFNPVAAEKTYNQSQWQQSQNISPDKVLDEWAIKNGYTGWKNYMDNTKSKTQVASQKVRIIKDIQDKGVSDSFLYGYAGYKYIHGTNPSLLNPEHPPLAKYLIGLSISLFGNEHLLGIVVGAATLALVGIISYLMFSSFLVASVAVALTSLFPLLTDQITHGPQLELYQLFFFLLLTYFLLMWEKKKHAFFCVCAGVSFGLLLSTKTFLPFFVLFGIWLFIVLWKRWKALLLIMGLGILVFIGTYYQYFVLGGTIKSFLGLQKYIITFYGNAHIPLLEFAGNYLRLIYTGTWKFWDSNRTVSSYSEWNILWPIIFTLSLWRVKMRMQMHKKYTMLVTFILLYNLFVFITPIFPRYLLLLYVPLIIIL